MTKILVIDDEIDFLAVYSAILKRYIPDCTVFSAASGSEGLRIAQTEQPDTILLDINMPEMDGFGVCKKLKSQPDTRNFPVVMVSGLHIDCESHRMGLDAGADAYLTKPIEPVLLASQVNVMLRIKRAEDLLRRENESLEAAVRERTRALSESEAAMRKAKEEAERASRAKSEFLSSMSHELRTPLNGVIGMLSLARETKLSEEQREFLDLAGSSADSLLKLINDILDFCKIEVGKLELSSDSVDIRKVVMSAVDPLRIAIDQKKLGFICEIPSDIPDTVVADEARLRQVILNLAGNAVKFTECGSVCIRVLLEQETEDYLVLHFAVSDTGIGIPENRIEEVFADFKQLDGSTTRKFGGTGLGLSICRRLVAMMGGRIWVESRIGAGSTFHFTVKAGLCTSTDLQPEMEESGPNPNLEPFEEQLSSELKKDPNLRKCIVEPFIEIAQDEIERLKKLVLSKDDPLIEMCTRRLAEAAKQTSLNRLADALFRLEIAARKEDRADYSKLMQKLELEFRILKAALSRFE